MEISMAFRHTLLNVGVIVIIILSTAKFSKNENDTEFNNVSNGSLLIMHYDVEIKINSYRNVIYGKCNIIIRINRAISYINMRISKIFNIIKVNLIDNDNQIVNILASSIIHNTFFDFTQIFIVVRLSPGTYVLNIIYVCATSDDRDSFKSLFEPFTSDTEKL